MLSSIFAVKGRGLELKPKFRRVHNISKLFWMAMLEPTPIRILEADNNRRGDLFGRLMSDLFVALGYEQPRLNVHKSGREIDLSANHRLLPHRALAECKATMMKTGGDEVNKFIGVLDAERNRKSAVEGYFVSLSGFKETAIEQEKQGRRTPIIMLGGPQIIGELIQGRILISQNRAADLAGRLCAGYSSLVLDPEIELLAHRRGWIWALYYTDGKARTHFALIHSDGTPLAKMLVDEIVAADRSCDGRLHLLHSLNPSPVGRTDGKVGVAQAMAAYGSYLTGECGYILLDGLPADADVGSRRLRLENLFVPLRLNVDNSEPFQPVGVVLSKHHRLALLSPPGGGKSTLLKRLAVAYVDPTRRTEINDELPDCDWFPLFIRCRELRDLARGSFAELLDALSQREPVRQHAGIFRSHLDRSLLSGKILMLVDGLDEISDPGDRAAFVCTLRSVLLAYPGIGLIVTSREAGFRHVAAHLAPVCTLATLSPFQSEDIRRLSVSWHREVVGEGEKVRGDAESLATTIAGNDRIRRLAVNPLLLTTLLLVKRWVGTLPTRRAVLYGKAVEVLLMTWNTEGHAPIPDEEALPQLCYVASWMMSSGVQKISRSKLASLLQDARVALPTELGYVKGSVDEFIHRVEDRSSLLMMSGHDVEDGRLLEFFEFRHLTFQEFLTARAMVEGWHEGRRPQDTLASVLEFHFADAGWAEVLPLAAVLGGKATDALFESLTKELVRVKDNGTCSLFPELVALCRCLADEAAASPSTVRRALREVVLFGWAKVNAMELLTAVARSKYGPDLRLAARAAFFSPGANLESLKFALGIAVYWQAQPGPFESRPQDLLPQFHEALKQPDTAIRSEGALGLAEVCMRLRRNSAVLDACSEILGWSAAAAASMLSSADTSEQFAAAHALGLTGACDLGPHPPDPDSLGRLFALWRDNNGELSRVAVRALANQPIVTFEDRRRCSTISPTDLQEVLASYDELENYIVKPAVLILAWYTGTLEDQEIDSRARDLGAYRHPVTTRRLAELLRRIQQSRADR